MESQDNKLNCEKTEYYKILIAENIPSLNKGEMSIFEGIIESFKFLGEKRISMFSDLPDIDKLRYGEKSKIVDVRNVIGVKDVTSQSQVYKIYLSIKFFSKHLIFILLYKLIDNKVLNLMKAEIWEEYLEADMLVIGHNGTFGAGWGMLKTPLYFYYMYIPFFAKVMGKRIVLYGGSIVKYQRFSRILGMLTRFSLNRIDLITLRETNSFNALKVLGVKNKNVYLKPDLAFLLVPESPEKIKIIMRKEGIKEDMPIIGITLTNEMAFKGFNEIKDLNQKYQKHKEIFVQLIDYLTNNFGALVVFIPHCIGFDKDLDDRIIAKEIQQLVHNKSSVKLIDNEYSPQELKGLLGEFDLFIGERIHSVVNSMSMNTPSVLISHSKDRRVGIIEMFEQDNVLYLDDITIDKLLSEIDSFFSKRKKIEKELESKIKIINQEALSNGELVKKLIRLSK